MVWAPTFNAETLEQQQQNPDMTCHEIPIGSHMFFGVNVKANTQYMDLTGYTDWFMTGSLQRLMKNS